MTDIIEQPTAEEIARHYAAALDSVALINSNPPAEVSDNEWADIVARNKEHLRIQLAKAAMYEGYDLKPLEDAAK